MGAALSFEPAFAAVDAALEEHGADTHTLIVVHTKPENRKGENRKDYYGEDVFCFCAGQKEHREEDGHH